MKKYDTLFTVILSCILPEIIQAQDLSLNLQAGIVKFLIACKNLSIVLILQEPRITFKRLGSCTRVPTVVEAGRQTVRIALFLAVVLRRKTTAPFYFSREGARKLNFFHLLFTTKRAFNKRHFSAIVLFFALISQ